MGIQKALILVVAVIILFGGYLYYVNDKGTRDSTTSARDSSQVLTHLDTTGQATPPHSDNPSVSTDAPVTVATPPSVQVDTNKTMIATITTNKGDITVELFGTATPKTVENFVKLASAGFYDGTRFHRVIKGFMIQGGDPLTKDEKLQARWGTGGPGYAFADEIGPSNSNVIGTLAMANAGPNTNGSQFFINTADNNFLNTKHTVFGKVPAGMDVVKAIESVQTGQADRPTQSVIVQKITVN